MFRIRRIDDALLAANRRAIEQVQAIFMEQFPEADADDILHLPEKLKNPFKTGFRNILFVAEGPKTRVEGFALLYHEPDLHFCYLDYLSAAPLMTGRGIGGALYERLRREAAALRAIGLFFECLPDDPRLCPDPAVLKQNRRRLRFYEYYGARPIVHTAYETPLKEGEDNPPYLVYDDLGTGRPLRRKAARAVVRAVLERKYRDICPPSYVERVVRSFVDDPVQIRAPRYLKEEKTVPVIAVPADRKIRLIVSARHELHHVKQRGYVESPARIASVLKELRKTSLFEEVPVRHFPESVLTWVHDPEMVGYFKRATARMPADYAIYPYVFPVRNKARKPVELLVRAGYYCIDTFTPLSRNAYQAARHAVDCALTGAGELVKGHRLAYALVRPPGHHAEKNAFGGFCYFNSAALAAHYLARQEGRAALLDIDFHHGNGSQDIFYDRDDVLTLSIHGHPRFAYPYFSGFKEERGEGPGLGYNRNYPLPEHATVEQFQAALQEALTAVRRFRPAFLVVALGLDTARGDPTGTWMLGSRDFRTNGRLIGELRLPVLVVQEGGYSQRNLGRNARLFFTGLWEGME
ncbi:MAG TPA: histone deacetylase family protein [bacterium]|nr:histone deacetylase family protein [bacterium]